MNSAVVAVSVLVAFVFGYRFYSKYLIERVFKLDEESGPTPAVELDDGVDFVPTSKEVLFGHHYSSIAGAAPIVGPAVAVIWGWVPAIIWVTLGTIFMGAVHDLGTLILSMRYKGIQLVNWRVESLASAREICFCWSYFFWFGW